MNQLLSIFRAPFFISKPHRGAVALIVVTVFIVMSLLISNHISNQNKSVALIEQVDAAVATYPDLREPYRSSMCYYRDGNNQWFLLQINGTSISGKHTNGNSATYYMNQKAWVLLEDGTLAEIQATPDDVGNVIKSWLSAFRDNTIQSKTFHKPSGKFLPLHVSPLDAYYVQVKRDGTETYTERMILRETEDWTAIAWSILDAKSEVVLYLSLSDGEISTERVIIPGWGEIPDIILREALGLHA